MTKARAWLSAFRPQTLTAAVSPVAVGAACALSAGRFRIACALSALFGAVAIQIGCNLVNDLADARRGADADDRLGPTRAVAAGLLSPRAVAAAAASAFLVATAFGLFLTIECGWPVVAIGLLSIAAAVAYTAGPFPLAYHGLGDLFVLLFFGLVATCGTTFVCAGRASALAFACGLSVGAPAVAILVVNNLRDVASDARANKRTLAVRLGERAAVVEYALCLAAAYAIPAALAIRAPLRLLPLVTIPVAVRLIARVARTRGRALNPLLGATARLALLHGLALAVGVALG